MKTFFSRQVAVLGLLALLGGGCVVQKPAQPVEGFKQGQKSVEAGGTKSIEIGESVEMHIPTAWRTYGDGSMGEIIYIYDCPESEDDYFCRDAVYTVSAENAQRALLSFSEKIHDFSWYCPESQNGFCDTDEQKLASVTQEDGYWVALTIGIADDVAIAIKHGNDFVIVFGRGGAQNLYNKYVSLIY